jgi:hypothetical protein
VVPVSYRAKPWVRAGGLYNHVEIEGASDGLLVADSKHTSGLEVGGGLEVALGGAWSLTPGLRYRRLEPTVRFGGVESSITLSDVTFRRGYGTEILTALPVAARHGLIGFREAVRACRHGSTGRKESLMAEPCAERFVGGAG